MEVIQHAAQQLIDGVDGKQVMEKLRYAFVDERRTQPRTLASLNATMTQVRAEVMARGVRSPSYDPTTLLALSRAEPDIVAFLGAPLNVQCDIQRHHTTHPSWSPAAELALSQLQLLPVSMNTFRLPDAQSLELKRNQELAQLRKNESVIVVSDAKALLQAAVVMLERANPTHSYASLVIPLALVTGRRAVELLNGKSTFHPSPLGCTYTIFDGQAKKRGTVRPYGIPLLCDYSTFCKGWSALRAKQGQTTSHTDTKAETLSNKQINTRYAKSLHRSLKQQVIPGLPREIKEHDLRSMYASYVFACYDCKDTFARTAMRVLGHESLHESLSYNNVRLVNAEAFHFGELQL